MEALNPAGVEYLSEKAELDILKQFRSRVIERTSDMVAIDKYWQALKRLKRNTPVQLPKGTAINKDTVALEAGRKRSSIKESKSNFSELISYSGAAILSEEAEPDNNAKLANKRAQKVNYRELYHQALNRELMLIEHGPT
ncbi:MAG: hypothetical protein PHF31_16695 [Methylobacter sp.]|nr:hypothetical protein [Methylobacter sp.]